MGKLRQRECNIANVIVSCMLLHNILCRRKDGCVVSEAYESDSDSDADVDDEVEENDISHGIGVMKREEIADMILARANKS